MASRKPSGAILPERNDPKAGGRGRTAFGSGNARVTGGGPAPLGQISAERTSGENLKIGIGTGTLKKSGGGKQALGTISVDRSVKAPPTHGPAS